MKKLEIIRIEKFFKEMGNMKYLRNTIIGLVVSIVTFAAISIAIKGINSHGSMNHNMASNAKDSVEHSTQHNVTSDNGQAITTIKVDDTNSVKSNEIAKDDNLKKDNSNLNTVPDDVVFVKYTVRANDTLWRIADTYMPEYNAYPEGDKEGVITFIVKENNLKKGNDGSYIIYSGQNLTIPKQKNIELAANINKSSTVVKGTDN